MKFLRTKNSKDCDAIQDMLKKLCIVHEIISVDENEKSITSAPDVGKPPVLIDNGQVVRGAGNIIDYLDELEGFKELWYKYQSDACYCDES